ncbi:MAG: F0F1 ATP synthase subunit delta [Candidatus Kerfeldbacteria bacterium]|nr:F0F1 ATP synthase subunit delta [Candidatus Kerfeldbacteria bacterium]
MRITAKQYACALFELLQDAPHDQWGTLSQGFLLRIYKRGETKLLPEILRYVDELQHQAAGTVPVTVTSAHTIDASVIEQALAKLLPHTAIDLNQRIDEQLIGGIRVETPNTRWDLSVHGQLHAIQQTLT